MAKLRKSSVKGTAIALRATGRTYQEIGDKLGVSDKSAATECKKHEDAITKLTFQIINDSIAPIRQNNRDCLQLAHELYQISLGNRKMDKVTAIMSSLSMLGLEPKDILVMADKKEHRMLQVMGITPSHAPSTIFNILFQGDRAQGDSQELGIVRALLESKRDDDIQDGEIVGGEESMDDDHPR